MGEEDGFQIDSRLNHSDLLPLRSSAKSIGETPPPSPPLSRMHGTKNPLPPHDTVCPSPVLKTCLYVIVVLLQQL